MPIAAVPAYLGNDFQNASPALRFGLLLPIWTNRQDQEREVNKRSEAGSREAWKHIQALSLADRDRMEALENRQRALSATVPGENLLRLDAESTAPFTTGLGNEHPLENGFAFLSPYGLPYLPGSGVKGVLRQAARELSSGEWGDVADWSEEKRYPLMRGEGAARKVVRDRHGTPLLLSMLDALFGREPPSGDADHVRGALSFWDVIPQIEGDSLMVEIMTPHQGHYYQWKKDQRGKVIEASPHDSGRPTPISFLTVPPKSRFVFHVQCDLAHLKRLAPALAQNNQWKTLLSGAFEHAFQWLGFGAKTAVGYGAMLSPTQRERRQKEADERQALEREAKMKAQAALEAAQAVAWQGARIKLNRANGSLSVEKDGKTCTASASKAQELLATLPPDLQKKVRENQFVKVTAFVFGHNLVRIEAP